MPETEENHWLDGAEFQDGLERRQQVARRKIEEIKSVQSQRHGHIVDDCYVDVAGVCAPVAVMIMSTWLQENDDECHDRLNKAELQRCLLAKPQEGDRVGFAGETASAIETRRLNWLAPDLAHDVTFAAQVLIAERQKVVDYKSWN